MAKSSPNKKNAPVLISVPHGGMQIPKEVIDRCPLSEKEVFDDSDAFTRDIFDFKDRVISYVDTDISRSIIDLNRSRDDYDPKKIDGVIKRQTARGASVFDKNAFPGPQLAEELLQKYYDPYHNKIDELIDQSPPLFALDCHSMDPVGPKHGKKPGKKRAIFCLSNGGDYSGFPIGKKGYVTCSPTLIINLAEILAQTFKISEEDVLLNDPFPGGHIIRSHYSERVPWIQLELNKNLYLTADKFDKRSRTCFPGIINKINERLWTSIQKLLNSL